MEEDTTPKPDTVTPATTFKWVVVATLLVFSSYKLVTSWGNYNAPPEDDAKPRSLAAVKYRVEGDRQFLWALGPKDPKEESSEWFELTGSPLTLNQFQYGIGRDRIASIDSPVFVDADDPKLRLRWGGSENADISDLRVIGYEHNGVARAYPIPLLDDHELVNDSVGGKPVTIGW